MNLQNIKLEFAKIMQAQDVSKNADLPKDVIELLMRVLVLSYQTAIVAVIAFPNNKQKQEQFLANIGASLKHQVSEADETISKLNLNHFQIALIDVSRKTIDKIFEEFFTNNGGYGTLVNSRALPDLLKEIKHNAKQCDTVGCTGYIMIALDLHHKEHLTTGTSLNKACHIATKSTEYKNKLASKNAAVFERYWNKYKIVTHFCIAGYIHSLLDVGQEKQSHTIDDLCQYFITAKAVQKWLTTYSPHGRMGKPLVDIGGLYILPDDAGIPDVDLRSIILPLKSSCLEVLNGYAAPVPMH